MPGEGETVAATSATTGAETVGLVPTQIASLVPTFDPSKDDLLTYTRKVELLVGMWPEGRWTELASRLILGCGGSAFLKLQIHQSEITKNEKKSIQRLIELLGGHWGQVNLERQYEIAERALFRCQQKGDESADSFLARADIMWSELYARNISLKDLQPYITLRGSQLPSEDKKRVLLDVDAAGTGKLSMEKVSASIRMLGAGFFHDMTGLRRQKGKTYDQAILAAESTDLDDGPTLLASEVPEDFMEEEMFETLAMEGDEDAALVADFETAATELLQGDEDLASAFNAYTEARRRLSEKVKFRGFWPVHQGSKGKGRSFGRGVKGKFSSKGSSRKTLQQRILESKCRICGKVGHWKAECPQRGSADSSRPSSSQVPTSYTQAQSSDVGPDSLPLEFLQIPENTHSIDEPGDELVFVNSVCLDTPKNKLKESLGKWIHKHQRKVSFPQLMHVRSEDSYPPVSPAILADDRAHERSKSDVRFSQQDSCESTCFATHGSFGVVDLGATKTVIGSELVPDLIKSLSPEVQKSLTRCKCVITFRFGNHGVLQSQHALVIPIHGFLLKVAIVPGSTPFLLSNTLLRALGAIIDTEKKELFATKINRKISLQLTARGLFLLDINELAESCHSGSLVETHVVSDAKQAVATFDVSSREKPLQRQDRDKIDNRNNLKNWKVDETSEPSTDAINHKEEQLIESNTSIDSNLCPKSITKGFVVPSNSHHGQPFVSTAKAPDHSGTVDARHESVQSASNGLVPGRFRVSSPWTDLQGGLGERPEVGEMDGRPLWQLREHQAQDVPSLRGAPSGESRVGRHSGGVHSEHRATETQDRFQGLWEVIPKGKAQGQVSGCGQSITGSHGRDRLAQRPRGLHVDSPRDGSRVPGHPTSGSSHDEHGECPHTGHFPLGEDHGRHECDGAHGDQVRDLRTEWSTFLSAGDICGDEETLAVVSEERNKEGRHFRHMMRKIQQELLEVSNETPIKASNHSHLFEVFCGPQSQLSHQAQQLGFHSDRFGFAQCDLQTSDGRKLLFRELISKKPDNVWFSPTCGPWSNWSNLNGNKSIQAWDSLHEERHRYVEQIALGVILLRYQRAQNKHFHWEQPRSSLMFRLPYLAEAFHYLLAVDFEMCRAGNLRDPQSGKPIRKAMTVLTTSRRLVDKLQHYRCPGDHDHQSLEGQTIYQGQRVNRTSFSENYPRKFARILVSVMCKILKPRELPYRNEAFVNVNETSKTEEPSSKRQRVSPQARLKLSRTLEADRLSWGKRQRLIGKTGPPIEGVQAWKEVFQLVDAFLPRVGKRTIDDPVILQKVRTLVTDMDVRYLVACRGSSRTIEPPTTIANGEAPFRKSIFTSRTDDRILVEDQWESWETLAKRQLVRPSHASHINITMFACNPERSSEAAKAGSSESSKTPEDSTVERSVNPEISGRDPTLSESQHCDLNNLKQPDSFRSLPRDEQTALIRCHRNLGHPSPEKLSTVLRQQGYRPEVARAALDLQCSVCQAGVQPKGHRPSSLRDEMDFNDRISVDGIKWTNQKGQNFHFYHVVDWATNFQAACIAPSRNSTDTIGNLITMWFSWAGSPSELFVDPGTEFQSDEFQEFVQQHNIKLITTAPEAHFQHGKAERHGAVLQHMLRKFELEHAIENYQDLQRALFWCVQAKNANSLRKGYAPEVLVLGKHTRLPGSICSDEMLPAHLLANSETAHGISFRTQLAFRESARKAFFSADNDQAIRKSFLRRSHPLQKQYNPGEWVMVWKEGKGAYQGFWQGPMRVVVHENAQVVWTTMASKLFRTAPELIRPVTALEARDIRILPGEATVSKIAQQLESVRNQGVTQSIDLSHVPSPVIEQVEVQGNPQPVNLPEVNSQIPLSEHPSESQPDDEPQAPSENLSNAQSPFVPTSETAAEVPVPVGDTDEELVCDSLICEDVESLIFHQHHDNVGWKCEILVSEDDISQWQLEDNPTEMAFLATAAKRQRSVVKMTQLTKEERKEFDNAKQTEVQNWLKTGTVSKIVRDKIPKEQILKCRWILTWKPLDQEDQAKLKKTQKAKARLVILGYLDPDIDQLPRDSPTLGRHSKMLLLQLISSMNWNLQSFDIKAAFLQGKPQTDRVLGIEPTSELIEALQMKTNEVCKLEKGAYGLIDAPYMWYRAILEELTRLGFEQSPFDPCVFILRDASTGKPDGVLGLHVDDGLCGGNQRFQTVLGELEKKYPFGSKRIQQFVFTGIDMQQHANKSISLSQSRYVREIPSIHISQERRKDLNGEVTPNERQELRALIGSLQYASVHTRPDISSRLSYLQSAINRATVETLIMGNQTLHLAKKHHDVEIKIQPIPLESLRFLAFSDASFASANNPSSHTGSMIMSTHADISKNVTCPVSPLVWGCKKIQRVVTSTLAAETVSLNTVLDQLSWVKLCWAWMLNPKTEWRRPTETLKTLPSAVTTTTYRPPDDSQSVAATDCKSLFDLVTRTAPPQCAEFRTQLAARSIKDMLAEGINLRWVHSGAQLADCLTKIMEASFMRETLRVGFYRLHDEGEVLKDRANARNRIKWLQTEQGQRPQNESS